MSGLLLHDRKYQFNNNFNICVIIAKRRVLFRPFAGKSSKKSVRRDPVGSPTSAAWGGLVGKGVLEEELLKGAERGRGLLFAVEGASRWLIEPGRAEGRGGAASLLQSGKMGPEGESAPVWEGGAMRDPCPPVGVGLMISEVIRTTTLY